MFGANCLVLEKFVDFLQKCGVRVERYTQIRKSQKRERMHKEKQLFYRHLSFDSGSRNGFYIENNFLRSDNISKKRTITKFTVYSGRVKMFNFRLFT